MSVVKEVVRVKKLLVLLVALAMVAVLIFGTVQSLQKDFSELSFSTVLRFGKKEAKLKTVGN